MKHEFLKPINEIVFKRRGLTRDVKSLMDSLQRHGQTRPVVIDAHDETNFNVDHELCEAAKRIGWKEVKVIQTISVAMLADNWLNGNISFVINILSNSHPALTAELLTSELLGTNDNKRISEMLNRR